MTAQIIKKNNDPKIFLNNYFNIILAAFLIIFLLLSYLVFLGPKFRATQAAIRANTEEKQLLYKSTQYRLASLKAISEIYKTISPADLQKFNSVLPDSYVRERLFGELEETVAQGGWLISSLSISSTADDASQGATAAGADSGQEKIIFSPVLSNTKVGTINLHLSIGAVDYQGFKNLLRLLENNLRLFDVTSVSFSPANNSASIVLTTYYYHPL